MFVGLLLTSRIPGTRHRGCGARKGREPYYAPNTLRGACFAKASQPEGAEDMSKGARGGPRQEYGAGGWECRASEKGRFIARIEMLQWLGLGNG